MHMNISEVPRNRCQALFSAAQQQDQNNAHKLKHSKFHLSLKNSFSLGMAEHGRAAQGGRDTQTWPRSCVPAPVTLPCQGVGLDHLPSNQTVGKFCQNPFPCGSPAPRAIHSKRGENTGGEENIGKERRRTARAAQLRPGTAGRVDGHPEGHPRRPDTLTDTLRNRPAVRPF